jgi:predicted PurR-regulated permease PerM
LEPTLENDKAVKWRSREIITDLELKSDRANRPIRMRTRTLPPNSAVALHGIWAILVLAFVVVALYFGRTVFVPIALAALITFLLSRLVSRLEKWIGRVPSVLLCVVVAFTILGAVGWIVGRQVVDLAGLLTAELYFFRLHSNRVFIGRNTTPSLVSVDLSKFSAKEHYLGRIINP